MLSVYTMHKTIDADWKGPRMREQYKPPRPSYIAVVVPANPEKQAVLESELLSVNLRSVWGQLLENQRTCH